MDWAAHVYRPETGVLRGYAWKISVKGSLFGRENEPDPLLGIRLYCVGRLWVGYRVVCSVAKHPQDPSASLRAGLLAGNLGQACPERR